ncbi:MAG TPA: serine/threonine-protein kinase [Thermoguttaceae bacterium]|nr:serine/threonine-protein kinase [Thermoguttaceae bacterium]
MGTVYKAMHSRLKKYVAIKVLPTGRLASPEAVARFLREMQVAGRLNHPNVVSALDAGEAGGIYYLAMELVEGVDLSALVARCGRLAVPDACEIVRQAALGLEAAHRQELVHRDVKPSNLMLDDEGCVKLLDLGLARLVTTAEDGPELTNSAQIVGTPDYMAPEQALQSRTVDIRADVYSLGCTLYKLLSGQAPFAAPDYDTPLKKVAGHARDPIPPLGRLRADVPESLVRYLSRMLAKLPDDRPASPSHVAEAMAPFCEGASLRELAAKCRCRQESKALPVSADVTTPAVVRSAISETARRLRSVFHPTRERLRRILGPSIALLLVLALIVAAVAFRIVVRTDRGVLVLEFPEGVPEDTEVFLDDRQVTLRQLDGKRGEVVFAEGEYGLSVICGDREFRPEGKVALQEAGGEKKPVVVSFRAHEPLLPEGLELGASEVETPAAVSGNRYELPLPKGFGLGPGSPGKAKKPAAGSGKGDEPPLAKGSQAGNSMTGLAIENTYAAPTGPGWPLELKWQYHPGKSGWAYPVTIHGSRVYVGNTEDGKIHALDLADGTLLWKSSSGGCVLEAPAHFDGLLYAAGNLNGNSGGQLLAIDPATGTTHWTWPNDVVTRLPCGPSPKIFEGLVFTGTIETRIGFLAVDQASGSTAWFRLTGISDGPYGNGACAICPRRKLAFYVLDMTGSLYALDAMTGEPRWQFESGQTANGSGPLVYDDRVCFGMGLHTKNVYCVDAERGTKLWERQVSTARGYMSYLCAAQGLVILRTTNQELLAMQLEDGEVAWRVPLEPGTGQPVIAGGVVYCTNQGALNAVSQLNGRPLGGVGAQDGWLTPSSDALIIRAHETGDVLCFARPAASRLGE